MLAPWSQDTLFIADGGLAMDVVDGTEEGAVAWHHRWQWQYLRMAGPMGAAAVVYPGFQRGGCLRSGPIRKVGREGGFPQLQMDYITALRERGDVIHPQLWELGSGYETGVCVCVCVFVYMHVCVCVCVCTCMCVHVNMHVVAGESPM